MSDTFERRLSAAVWAAWWTIGVWWLLLMFSWGASMVIMHVRPAWVLEMLGGDASWSEIQDLYLWFLSAFKILGLVAALGALFMTLWRRRLKRSSSG